MIKYYLKYLFIFLISITLINCSRVDVDVDIDIDYDSNSGSYNNNDSMITVFLIPHSHCDLGWVQTLEQYYTENVTLILDNVIDTLIKDSTKKFNWAETYYFQAWWNEQSSILQSQVRNLVYNKQLYFIGGGWAQNDEAVTHYQAVINQMTLGHQFLLSEFNFVPEIGWQIDPFGPSTLTATLFSLMGFKYHVINRIDERIKYQYFNPNITGSGWMTTDKSFEFIWYPSQSDDKLSIFTHVLDHHYNSPYLIYPNATNPNISITTGFDFESDPIVNPPINDTNIHERAAVLVEIIKQRAVLYRHNNLLLPFGNDFRYQNASAEFINMDKLIEYINSNSSNWGVYIKYATLNEYFEKVEKDTNTNSTSSNSYVGDEETETTTTTTTSNITFPEIVGQDLFVYTMCLAVDYQNFNTCANWWSGYYTSYPLLKQTIRDSDSLLRVGEMLYSLSSSYSNGYDFDFDVSFYALDFHRNVSGILTHHDAVTGTAKSYVRDDYFNMLDEAQTLTSNYNVPDLVGYLLSNKSLNRDYSSNNLTLVNATEGDIIAVSFSNSLAWDRFEHVSIEVPLLNIAVYDYQLNPVVSQIVQRLDKDGKWYLHMSVATPALGISTYFVVILASNGELTIDNQYLPTPIPSIITEPTKIVKDETLSVDGNGNTVSIGNSLFNLNFEFDSSNSNLLTLKSFDDLVKNQLSIPIKQHLIEYTSLSDDAYKFRVQGVPIPLKPVNPQFYLTSGPIVQIVTIVYNSNCSQSYLVYNDTAISNNPFSEYSSNDNYDSNNTTMIRDDQYFEIDNIVAAGWDKEISILFSTSIENGNTFFTNNGLEIMKREWKIHWNDTFIWSEITGNFYPVVNTGYISDNEKQFTILTKQSVGASSQTNGDFELLLIRRSNYTQWSVHEGMNDTSNPSIRIRCFLSDPINSNTIRTPHSILFENPLTPVYAKVDYPLEKYVDVYNTLFKPLTNSFPYNLHLVTFTKQWMDSQTIIMRLLNIYELNQNQFFSKPVNLSMNTFLTHYNISQITETSLSANTVLSKHDSDDDLTITLEPLQLKTYLLTLNPKK